jgi:hypothetical protein
MGAYGWQMTMNTLTTERQGIEQRPASRSGLPWILGTLGGALLTIALLGALAAGFGVRRILTIWHGSEARINVDQPTVIRQIQSLQRLETVSYTMDKIISGEHANAYWPKFLVGDRLLLMVHGEVVAGINLAELQPGEVAIHGQQISIHLPAAEIFSTRIDNAKTKVYSRDTGLFSSPDPNLESQVREAAEQQLQQAALQDGILKTADGNARSTILSMLQGLGFHEVTIQ